MFLVFSKGQKNDKRELMTKFVEIIVTIIVIFSQIASKIFASKCCFNDQFRFDCVIHGNLFAGINQDSTISYTISLSISLPIINMLPTS